MDKKCLTSVPIAFLLLFALLIFPSDFAFIHLVYASDSYGNDINSIEVWQWNDSAYNLKANFTSTGGSVRVHDGWVINFTVSIKMNNTLVSSTSEAIDYTRVYMNITYNSNFIWNNIELNNTSCELIGNFYYLKEQGHWNQTDYPQSGITYECSVLYQGYY